MYGYGMISFYIWLILLSDPLSCGYSNCPSVIRPTWKPGWGSACRLSINATDVYKAVVKGECFFRCFERFTTFSVRMSSGRRSSSRSGIALCQIFQKSVKKQWNQSGCWKLSMYLSTHHSVNFWNIVDRTWTPVVGSTHCHQLHFSSFSVSHSCHPDCCHVTAVSKIRLLLHRFNDAVTLPIGEIRSLETDAIFLIALL